MLPRYDDGFIGRADLAPRLDLLFSTGENLVVLTGPAGIGKTRVAVEYARGRERVRFCDLANARTGDDLCAEVATALGMRDTAGVPDVARRVAERISRRPPGLLVLDCFEHVADHAAVLNGWRDAGVDILVTSRVDLALDTAQEIALEPMGTDGVALFEQRAEEAGADLRTDLDRAHVDALVDLLDGFPLAIELAAARLDIMSVKQLRERLTDRFALLRDPDVSDPRHATLWRALEWSWMLLEDDERVALGQIGVFEGGFELEAAQGIVQLPQSSTALSDVLAEFVRNSWLRVEWFETRQRFTLFDSIRDYARRKCTDGSVMARHTRWFAARAAQWHDDDAHADRLVDDRFNLYAALERAEGLDLARLICAVRNISTLGRGHDFFVAQMVRLDHVEEVAPIIVRAWLTRGVAARFGGDLDTAEVCYRRAQIMAEQLNDEQTLAYCRGHRMDLYAIQGEHERVRALVELNLAEARARGDERMEAMALNALGNDYDMKVGDFATAEQRQRDALEVFVAGEHATLEGVARTCLGEALLAQGRLEQARLETERALDIHIACQAPQFVVAGSAQLARIHHHAGDLAAARREYTQCIELADDRTDGFSSGHCHAWLALLALEVGADPRPHLARADEILVGQPRFQVAVECTLLRGVAYAVGQGSRAQMEAAIAHTPALAGFAEFADAWRSLWEIDPDDLDDMRGRLAASCIELPDQGVLAIAQRTLEKARRRLESTWWIADDGTWLQPPDTARVDVSNRPTLSRILAVLASHGSQTDEEMLAAGWPGERMAGSAAKNRLHVAVSHLRKLGLSPLRRVDDGYLLDAIVQVVRRGQGPREV